MRKRELENEIYEKKDKKLLKFLIKNYMVQNVKREELKKNINTYKSLDSQEKQILLSRLQGIEEKFDLTTVFVAIVAIITGFVGAYGSLLESLEDNKKISLLVVVSCYFILIFAFTYILSKFKDNKGNAKYFINLFKQE
ncbi:hypothetical protein [Lysinibacillus sp. JNUCC-52]|uniref:hypothetical protein n=1 Tax=Lysinibacillus sp. JNUCC-52 TaxID=2792480 RepID=UPI0019372325|nr:hypothetical protein JNUCC52_01110 [Lysinibacillus sp. JNUCC-52]